MMNSVNVSVANAVINAPGTTTTIMKSTSSSNSASGSQPTISLQPNVTGGIIPGTIIATTNSQQQSANHDPQLQSVVGNQQPSVTTFTIHAPTQPLTNNHLTVCSAASTVTQMQSINANSSIIHQSNIGVSTPSVVTTILPSATGPQVTIPLNVTSVPTVLKPQASVALPIGQRFQSMTSVTGPNGQPSGQINTLFIHHDPLNVGKAPTIAHSSSSSGVHQQQPTHGPSQSVINATVSIPGSTVTIPAAHSNQSNSVSGGSSGGGTPLFIQTNNHQQHSSNATNILHSVATATAQAQAAAAQVTNLSATINLSTSAHSTVHQQQQQQQQFQRLKVEDALSYLDQVKFKFNDQPQVYNDFLDIMKEFKSQSIDTPGVIQRVSNLFKGHPELIVGFNTFLPPGYKIEIHANDQVNVSMPNSTNVVLMSTNPMLPSQPTGVATSTIVTGPGIHAQQQTMTGNLSRNSIVPPPPSSSSSQVATSGVALHTAPPQQQSQSASHNQNLVAQTYSNSIVGSNRSDHSNATSLNLTRVETINNTMGRVDVTRSQHVQPSSITQPPGSSPIGTSGAGTPQPVEFNHAINYVNKIKNRFQHQPEVYKQFLDILQNYQKDQRSKDGIPCTMASGQKFLTETEVFTKVAKLFQNQDDLLQEFSQFLPDANGNSSASIGGTHGQSTTLLSMSQPNIPISSVPNPGQLTSYNLVSGPSTGGSVAAAAAAQSAVNYSQPMVDSIVGSQYVSVNSIGNDGSSSTSSNVQMMKKPLNMTSSGSIHSGGSRQASNVNSSPTGYHNQPNAQQSAHSHRMPKRQLGNGSLSNISGHHGESSNAQHPPPKRSKQTLIHETDGSKYMGELSEYAFFDKLKAALNHPIGYSNFLKSLNLYTNQTINQSELFQLITPIFHRLPDLFKRFKDILGSNQSHHHKDYHQSSHHFYGSDFHHNSSGAGYYSNSYSNQTSQLEGLSHRVAMMKDRSLDNDYVELDFNQCKRYGLSYRTIPKNSARQECSGRTQLCHEVLNDTLVSFPSWSEDSTFVSSRKTTYEEHIYRTEDERYELDHVIETNFATIKLFATLMRKIDLMSSEEKNNFRLDDYLGGTSKVIHQKAVRRIYGDKAQGIIDALKFAPARSIPVVYNRLVYKDEEWREAQKQFNKSWRDQLEKYYLKSLDHQGINFKPNDIKNFRSKTLLNEIENIFDERSDNQANEQQQQQQQELQQTQSQPHLTYTYTDKTMIEVACNLIIHHVKRQTSIHVDDKKKIKSMMLLFIPDFFGTSLGDLSDDEIDDDEGRTSDHRQDEANTPKQGDSNSEQASSDFDSISESISVSSSDSDSNCSEGVDNSANSETDSNWGSDDSSDEEMIIDDEPDKDGKVKDEEDSTATTKIENEKDKTDSSVSMAPKDYTLFFANEFWYYFFRLHHTLCERLSRMHKHSLEIAAEEASQKHARDNSPASQLGYRTNLGFNVEDYFTALIDMVKQLLDGNLDSNQYEDTLREMFGINAYICFTFDKLVTAIVRQLQHIVADEVSQHCADMCIDAQMSENVRRTYAASNFRRIEEEAVYQRQSEQMMSEEHCFKIIIYPCGKITFELLASEEEESESESEEDEESNSTQSSRTLRSSGKIGTNSEVGNKKWADVDDDDDDDRSSFDRVKIDDDLLERLELNPLFLKRCVRNYKSQANISKTTKTSLQVPNNNNNKNNISQDQDDKDKEQSSTTLNEDSNSNRKFSNQDKSQNECQLSFKNFNSVVLHDDFSLCRRDSIIKARESHKKVSEHKKRKFAKWYQEFTISHLNIED